MIISLKRQVSALAKTDTRIKQNGRLRIKYILEGGVLLLFLSLFFYRSLWALPFLSPIYFLYLKEKKRLAYRKWQKEVTIQFKDAILAWSANLKTGYSVENAFKQVYQDMVLLYGKDGSICRELYSITVGLGNNMVLEKMLHEFGIRSGVEDIREFAEVIAAAKRNGGNLTEVIERSASIIAEKVETEKEIEILLSARQIEQKIMNIVPFGILLYINITSKGYFDTLYHNAAGVLIMTVCLVLYITAVLMSGRIVNIEV